MIRWKGKRTYLRGRDPKDLIKGERRGVSAGPGHAHRGIVLHLHAVDGLLLLLQAVLRPKARADADAGGGRDAAGHGHRSSSIANCGDREAGVVREMWFGYARDVTTGRR